MTAKRYIARTAGVIVALVFAVGLSVGAYFDTRSWWAVAMIWGFIGACLCAATVLVWALENWNAE